MGVAGQQHTEPARMKDANLKEKKGGSEKEEEAKRMMEERWWRREGLGLDDVEI